MHVVNADLFANEGSLAPDSELGFLLPDILAGLQIQIGPRHSPHILFGHVQLPLALPVSSHMRLQSSTSMQ